MCVAHTCHAFRSNAGHVVTFLLHAPARADHTGGGQDIRRRAQQPREPHRLRHARGRARVCARQPAGAAFFSICARVLLTL